jgi:tetratricopeptide (TPR) repeat protein
MQKNPLNALTVEKKMLINALNYINFESKFEVPFFMTQEGLAESIGIRRDNVPRTMKKLKNMGLFYEKVVHIEKLKRKRKVYFLTKEGIDFGLKIKRDLENFEIGVVTEAGEKLLIPIAEVNNSLSSNYTMMEIINAYDGRDQVLYEKDLKLSLEKMEKVFSEGEKLVHKIQDAPLPKFFVGRDNELSDIRDHVNSEDSHVIVIHGIAGIGKTTLALKVVQEYLDDKNILWYRFHKWDTLRNTLATISEFMMELDKKRLKSYLASHSTIDLHDLLTILMDDLEESNTLFVFDDFQRVKENIGDFFNLLNEVLMKISGVGLIVVGRQIMPFYDRSDVIVKKRIMEIQLAGLDEESSKKLLHIKELDEELFRTIYDLTKGHPLFLELLTSVEDIKEQKDIKRYIYEEIFSKLVEEERAMLQIISVYRYPVASKAFFLEEGIHYETLDKLVERALVQEISYDEYDVHDLIREFFYTRLNPTLKEKYHKEAAEYYMEEGDDRSRIEAQYHFIKSGQQNKAMKFALVYGQDLISKGHVESFLDILNMFEKDDVPESWADLMLLKADILTISGDWDKALAFYDQSILICEKSKNDRTLSEALRKKADLFMKRAQREKARVAFEESLTISEKVQDNMGIAECLRGLGHLSSVAGDFDKAIENYEKALEYAKKMNHLNLIAKIYIDLGTVYGNTEDFESAIKFLEMGIEVLEETGDVYETAKLYNNLGIVLRNTGNLDRALFYFEQCIKLSENNGDIRQLAYGLNSAGTVYSLQGDFKLAVEYLDEARQIFEKLQERFKIATIYVDYGIIYKNQKTWTKALKNFEKGIKILEELKLPYYIGKAYYEMAMLYKAQGKKAKTKSFIKKANAQYKKIGFFTKVKKVKKVKP